MTRTVRPPRTPPTTVTKLEDMKPRPAPTGRVILSRPQTDDRPAEPEPPRTITTDLRLYLVTKETDVQIVHSLVRARTRDEAIKLAGYERAHEVLEVSLEGAVELVWDCCIQNVEEDDFFGDT